MNLDRVSPGKQAPDEINVIIEIPAHAEPVKYEVDKETGAMFVDRFLKTSMRYPCNYGYVPRTLSEDGDPVDVLVITPAPLISGSVIRCRPVGVLKMTDEAGPDAKVLALPARGLRGHYEEANSITDVPKGVLDLLGHFFEHYKDLDPDKWVKIDGWAGVEAAKKEVLDSIKRYDSDPDKPCF